MTSHRIPASVEQLALPVDAAPAVRAALQHDPNATDEQVLRRVMGAFKGTSNPKVVLETIRRLRAGKKEAT